MVGRGLFGLVRLRVEAISHAASLSAADAAHVRALLEQVSVPTLVLHARDDAVILFAAGRELAERVPKAEFVALESHDHLPLEMSPRGNARSSVSEAFWLRLPALASPIADEVFIKQPMRRSKYIASRTVTLR